MESLHLGEINWWAVFVAAIATFLLGGLWHTALFGKLWQKLQGYSDEKLQAMRVNRPPAVFFSVMIVSYLVLAGAVALLFGLFGVRSAFQGAWVGFLLWLGPTAAIAMTGHIASDKPFGAYLIDASFQLIYLIMMGAIIGGWRM
jgi:hypothetical protein